MAQQDVTPEMEIQFARLFHFRFTILLSHIVRATVRPKRVSVSVFPLVKVCAAAGIGLNCFWMLLSWHTLGIVPILGSSPNTFHICSVTYGGIMTQ